MTLRSPLKANYKPIKRCSSHQGGVNHLSIWNVLGNYVLTREIHVYDPPLWNIPRKSEHQRVRVRNPPRLPSVKNLKSHTINTDTRTNPFSVPFEPWKGQWQPATKLLHPRPRGRSVHHDCPREISAPGILSTGAARRCDASAN